VLIAAGIDFRRETIESNAQRGCHRRRLWHDQGEFRTQEPGIGPGEEQRDAQTFRGELIAVGMGNTLNDAVETEAAKIVGHPSDRIVGRVEAQQLRQQRAHFAIIEPTELETEYDEHGKQGLYARVAEG
jgi:hypothetical protein